MKIKTINILLVGQQMKEWIKLFLILPNHNSEHPHCLILLTGIFSISKKLYLKEKNYNRYSATI